MRGMVLVAALILGCSDALPGGDDFAVADLGVVVDLARGDDAAECRLSSGRTCDPVVGCVDDHGCNWCGCTHYGKPSSIVECTLVGCFVPQIRCRTPSDCATELGATRLCIFDPGCDQVEGRCVSPSVACQNYGFGNPLAPGPHAICDCSGRTVTVETGCGGVNQPYRNVGACP